MHVHIYIIYIYIIYIYDGVKGTLSGGFHQRPQPRAATARAGNGYEQRLPNTARARSLVALSSQGVSAVQPCRGRGWHSPQQCNRALYGAWLVLTYVAPRRCNVGAMAAETARLIV